MNSNIEQQRHHIDQLESELKSLKVKYEEVCERVHTANHQVEHVQVVLEQTSRRCEQLEKEKVLKYFHAMNYIEYTILFYDLASLATQKIGIHIIHSFYLLLAFEYYSIIYL